MEQEEGYLKDFCDYLRDIKKFSLNTVKAYRQDIEQFQRYFSENEVTVHKETIRDFISSIFIRSRNKATISRKIYSIKTYYAYLLKRGIIERNPFDAISSPKVDRKMPQILTEREIIQFLDALPAGKFLEVRNRAIFEFLYATGLPRNTIF